MSCHRSLKNKNKQHVRCELLRYGQQESRRLSLLSFYCPYPAFFECRGGDTLPSISVVFVELILPECTEVMLVANFADVADFLGCQLERKDSHHV